MTAKAKRLEDLDPSIIGAKAKVIGLTDEGMTISTVVGRVSAYGTMEASPDNGGGYEFVSIEHGLSVAAQFVRGEHLEVERVQ